MSEEPVQEATPEVPPVIVDASTLQEIKTGIASASVFPATDARTLLARPISETVVLDAIARSYRVKAEACIWAVERQKLIVAGADFSMEVAPRDRELIEKARALEDCFLWMTKTAPMPEPLELYLELADRYENAADAADLLAELAQQNDEQGMLEDAMSLGAEAQSALREAVWKIGYWDVDSSQTALFHWLQQIAQDRHVYISRYMGRGDKPEKSEIESLGGRIAHFKELQQTHAAAKKLTANKVNTINSHLSQISPGRNNAHDWNKIFTVIEEIVPEYLQPNDARLRELLIKFIDEIPEETVVPEAGEEVLDAIDHYLATQPEVPPAKETQIELSPEVTALKQRLQRRTIVIIGGEARPYAKEALRGAFDLREVVWISTREHQSPEPFRAPIQVPGVAVVLLAIRWSSHVYGAVRDYCKDANVPFVRLPAGYSPTQVAHQIIEQVPSLLTA